MEILPRTSESCITKNELCLPTKKTPILITYYLIPP